MKTTALALILALFATLSVPLAGRDDPEPQQSRIPAKKPQAAAKPLKERPRAEGEEKRSKKDMRVITYRIPVEDRDGARAVLGRVKRRPGVVLSTVYESQGIFYLQVIFDSEALAVHEMDIIVHHTAQGAEQVRLESYEAFLAKKRADAAAAKARNEKRQKAEEQSKEPGGPSDAGTDGAEPPA